MIDRLLSAALNGVIMTLISLSAAGSLVCAHWGLLRVLGGTPTSAGGLLVGAIALAIAAGYLIRSRNDLVDR